jgi:hypothetical protein
MLQSLGGDASSSVVVAMAGGGGGRGMGGRAEAGVVLAVVVFANENSVAASKIASTPLPPKSESSLDCSCR